jgi:hypothetical protein
MSTPIWKELPMRHISSAKRLWLVATLAAITAVVAAALALAGGPVLRHARTPSQQRLIRYGIDDTLPEGPSDPPGLVGVHVSAASELAHR